MRAAYIEQTGPPEGIQVGDLPRPEPGPGQVLVRVHAAGLDRGTWHLMVGRPYLIRLALGLRRPRQPVSRPR